MEKIEKMHPEDGDVIVFKSSNYKLRDEQVEAIVRAIKTRLDKTVILFQIDSDEDLAVLPNLRKLQELQDKGLLVRS